MCNKMVSIGVIHKVPNLQTKRLQLRMELVYRPMHIIPSFIHITHTFSTELKPNNTKADMAPSQSQSKTRAGGVTEDL